jgi:hypothetical protein
VQVVAVNFQRLIMKRNVHPELIEGWMVFFTRQIMKRLILVDSLKIIQVRQNFKFINYNRGSGVAEACG